MKIELTDEIIKVIENCDCDNSYNDCDIHCPLTGACLQWFTGDDSENK